MNLKNDIKNNSMSNNIGDSISCNIEEMYINDDNKDKKEKKICDNNY